MPFLSSPFRLQLLQVPLWLLLSLSPFVSHSAQKKHEKVNMDTLKLRL